MRVTTKMVRTVLCLLALQTSSCDALWRGFTEESPESCRHGGTVCASGYFCDGSTGQCVRNAAPILTGVFPPVGSNAGGVTLELTGQNFKENAKVSIAGEPATAVSIISPTLITAVLPTSPRGFGPVEVVVQNPDRQAATRDDLFAYHASVPLSSLPSICLSGTRPVAALAADFNRDGKLDVALVNNQSRNVSILLGDGMSGFGPSTNYNVGLDPVAIVAGDDCAN